MSNKQQRVGPYGVAVHSGPYGIMPAALVFDRRISAEAKLVYAALATHADHESNCNPRQLGLAGAIGVSQGTLSVHIKALVRAGWVVVKRQQRRNSYHLTFQKPEPGYIDPINMSESSHIDPINIDPINIDPINDKNRPAIEQKITSDLSLLSERVEREHTGEVWDRGEGEYPASRAQQAAKPRESASHAQKKPEALRYPPEQHPLYHAACEALKTSPRSDGERKAWSIKLFELGQKGVQPDDMGRMVRKWNNLFPNARVTLYAIVKHLGLLQPPIAPQGASKPSQPAPAAEEYVPCQQAYDDRTAEIEARRLQQYREWHDKERAAQRAKWARPSHRRTTE